jgi:hypothetical protein
MVADSALGLLAFTRMLGMDPEEAEKLCRDATNATKNKSLHSYAHQSATRYPAVA